MRFKLLLNLLKNERISCANMHPDAPSHRLTIFHDLFDADSSEQTQTPAFSLHYSSSSMCKSTSCRHQIPLQLPDACALFSKTLQPYHIIDLRYKLAFYPLSFSSLLYCIFIFLFGNWYITLIFHFCFRTQYLRKS